MRSATAAAAAIATVAIVQLALVHVHNQQKPLTGAHPAPWNATRETPLSYSFCQYVVGSGAAKHRRYHARAVDAFAFCDHLGRYNS